MNHKLLDRNGIIYVYEKYLTNDFISDERRPLEIILGQAESGEYVCFGFYDGDVDTLLGYAFFYKHGRNYLLDYFAVAEERRNGGIGSEILRMLPGIISDAACIMVEVEDFDFYVNDGQVRRRYDFYMKNGYTDSGVRIDLWGVRYRLIEYDMKNGRTGADTRNDYLAMYRAMMPYGLYIRNVKIV